MIHMYGCKYFREEKERHITMLDIVYILTTYFL